MTRTIRPLPAHEAAQLLPLLAEVHNIHVAAQPSRYVKDPDPREILPWLKDWLSGDHLYCLASGPSGDLTAYLIYEVQRHETSPLTPPRNRAMLHHISVAPTHRRTGLGRALITAMRDDLRTQGVAQIAVTYSSFNTASAALMRSEGLLPVIEMAEGPV